MGSGKTASSQPTGTRARRTKVARVTTRVTQRRQPRKNSTVATKNSKNTNGNNKETMTVRLWEHSLDSAGNISDQHKKNLRKEPEQDKKVETRENATQKLTRQKRICKVNTRSLDLEAEREIKEQETWRHQQQAEEQWVKQGLCHFLRRLLFNQNTQPNPSSGSHSGTKKQSTLTSHTSE